jgi:hypothetical protein
MKKKDYYTYTSSNTLYVNEGSVAIEMHPDHIDVLDLDFKIGDLVETHKKELGIIIGISENKNHVLYHLGCSVYKVQILDEIKTCGSLSIKKIKNP